MRAILLLICVLCGPRPIFAADLEIRRAIEFANIDGAYEKLGLASIFHVVHGGAHGGDAFYDEERLNLVDSFLDHHLNQPSP